MHSARSARPRHGLLALAFLAAWPATLVAQFNASYPEPLKPLRGTVFVGGSTTLPADVYAKFRQVAGGDDANLVVLAQSPTHPTPPGLDATRLAWPSDAATTAGVVDRLKSATGVWVVGTDAQASASPAVQEVLSTFLERGGVVGCAGPIARAFTATRIADAAPHAAVATGLDVIPGAVIEVGFDPNEDQDRLLGVVASKPRLVGLGIEPNTCMVLHRRFIDVLGKGSVYACIAGNTHQPVRIEEVNERVSPRTQRRASRGRSERAGRRRSRGAWRPRRLEDLVAMSRSALARTLPKFPADEPPAPNVPKGSLMIVGGGGSPPGFMDRFIELAGGKNALLLYIPCTESEVVNADRMLAAWRRAGATNVDFIHTKDRHVADTSKEIHSKLRRAGGLFFGGGRQWNLVDSWQHTEAHRLMNGVLERGGVIAGSSAGASIQASYMVRGNSLGNVDPMAEGYDSGLGFVTGVAVDQHFAQRRRLPDMTSLVNRYPQLLGIGIDEAACIIVQGTVATCFCREGRHVHFYDRRRPVVPGEPDHLTLEDGQKFDLAERRVVK